MDPETRLLFTHLEEIKESIKEIQTPSAWTDLKGAVKYSSCSRSTILRGIHSGNLKHTKHQGKIRIKISWLDSWLLNGNCNRQTFGKKSNHWLSS
jgi:hypothetical protein